MDRRAIRVALVALELFTAVSALAGAIFVVPFFPLEWIDRGPFTNFTIPAIALGTVGVFAAMTAVAVVWRPLVASGASVVLGCMLVAFELVEIAIVGFAPAELPQAPQSWLQPLYLATGVLIALLGIELYPVTSSAGARRPSRSAGARPRSSAGPAALRRHPR